MNKVQEEKIKEAKVKALEMAVSIATEATSTEELIESAKKIESYLLIS